VPLSADELVTYIRPEDYFAPDSLRITERANDSTATTAAEVKPDSGRVESTGFGRFLISSRQKIQTINLRKFITDRPFQVSLIPGISTHGRLNSQVINKFSLNIFGGYSGGVHGMEVGSLFNIDRNEVKYIQAAGLFNIVGGAVTGLQAAGLNNTVLAGVKGLQAAGVNNFVTGNFAGLQAAGVYNHVSGTVKGFQVAGVGNFARQKVTGAQVAGVVNFSNKEMAGTQIAGVINYAKKLTGLQIGLINIADSSEGYSIGLINFVLKGYHKLSFSTNEVLNANVAIKTGNKKLYSILQAGMDLNMNDEKVYSFGYGMGTEIGLGKTFSVNPELTSQYLYFGSFDYLNLLNKVHLNLNVKLGKYVSLFAGPSFNVYYAQQAVNIVGYKPPGPPSGYNQYNFGNKVTGWIGWNAGINFF
jgi:hypothetical protein